jgi:hypothetical protein
VEGIVFGMGHWEGGKGVTVIWEGQRLGQDGSQRSKAGKELPKLTKKYLARR